MKVFKLGSGVNLCVQNILRESASKEVVPVNHYWVIDISGSMYGELPKIRTQLKSKIFELVKPIDTVTLVAFSGANEFFVLFENEKIADAGDRKSLYDAIDLYLTPRGLTGFKCPLEQVITSISNLKVKGLTSLFFMTDGYDNQSSVKDILHVCKKLAPKVDNAVIVEYGWYCNHALLSDMAQALGGALMFSKEFNEYSSLFEGHLNQTREKKIAITPSVPLAENYNWFFYSADESIVVSEISEGVLYVPESCDSVGYFSTSPATQDPSEVCPLSWAALAALSQKADTEKVFEVLSHCGDVKFINQFTNCFSKEDYISFQKDCTLAHYDSTNRYVEGFDRNAVPAEDAYTVLDLLEDLSSDDNNLFYPYQSSFEYQKISASTEQKEGQLKFKISDTSKGYPISGLTWNESRPNVSILVTVPGFVTLPADRPSNLPEQFPSVIFRNYTIIRDGIVHTRQLPVSLSEPTFKTLQKNGLLRGEIWSSGKIYSLSFAKVPVINRKMVKSISASEFFELTLKLAQLKGTQKVLNDLKNKFSPRTSQSFQLLYGDVATAWLKEHGLTDYSGFSPSVTVLRGEDMYVGYELKTAVKGASSLPKVEDVKSAIADKKPLKVAAQLMRKGLITVEKSLNSSEITASADPMLAASAWIDAAAKQAVSEVRALNRRLSQLKFALVVGHAWFKEFSATPGEASMEVSIPGEVDPVTVTASLKEVNIVI